MNAFVLFGLGSTASLFVTFGLASGSPVVAIYHGPLMGTLGGVYAAGGTTGGVIG